MAHYLGVRELPVRPEPQREAFVGRRALAADPDLDGVLAPEDDARPVAGVRLELLTQPELLLDFATNPRLMERFKARLDDYQFIWNSIRENAVMNLGRDEVFRIYGYLDQTPSVAAAAQELPVSGLSTADFSGGM